MDECPYCGEPLADPDDVACSHCGESLVEASGSSGISPVVVIVIVVVGGLCVLVSLVAAFARATIPNLIEARKKGNEAAAIGGLKTLGAAESLFREGDKEQDGELDYGKLAELGNATLIDTVLASGTKQGYLFACQPSSATPEFLWMAVASPVLPTTTGDRYFVTNHEGIIYYSETAPFTLDDACEIPSYATPVGR